jgi:hypothetical protein
MRLILTTACCLLAAAVHAQQPLILGPPCVYDKCAPGYSPPPIPSQQPAPPAPVYTCWTTGPDARNTVAVVGPWVEYRASENEIIARLTSRWNFPFTCDTGSDFQQEHTRMIAKAQAYQRQGYIVRPLQQ